MEKFSYSKELLLYEKNNSITNDLCDDIISIFENNNENVDIINNDDNYEKIKLYLFNEIKKNFNCYMENIDKNINIFIEFQNLKDSEIAILNKGLRIIEIVNKIAYIQIKS